MKIKPDHHLIAVLKSHGCNHTEIAKSLDLTESFIDIVCEQEFFAELLMSKFADSVDVAKEYLESQVEPMLKRLTQLAHSASNESVKRAAANDLLDRHWGKPMQHIKTEHKNVTLADAKKKMPEIDREINDILKKLATRGHGFSAEEKVS